MNIFTNAVRNKDELAASVEPYDPWEQKFKTHYQAPVLLRAKHFSTEVVEKVGAKLS